MPTKTPDTWQRGDRTQIEPHAQHRVYYARHKTLTLLDRPSFKAFKILLDLWTMLQTAFLLIFFILRDCQSTYRVGARQWKRSEEASAWCRTLHFSQADFFHLPSLQLPIPPFRTGHWLAIVVPYQEITEFNYERRHATHLSGRSQYIKQKENGDSRVCLHYFSFRPMTSPHFSDVIFFFARFVLKVFRGVWKTRPMVLKVVK